LKKITTSNPATDEELETYTLHTDEEVEKLILRANRVFQDWKKTSYDHRSKLMLKAADVLQEYKEEYAKMMTLEMGKTYASAKAEVEKCAWVCKYYAENAESFLADEEVVTDATMSKICYRPLGTVLSVMPWNYPLWQVFRFAAPALMAGNAGILKHASNVPGSALNIEAVFEKAGFPKGLFTTLLISSGQVENVLNNPLVKAATLTGSGPAGTAVASEAGKRIKKTVLELGGSDPYIILEDANIDLAVEQCAESRLLNTGQSCIGAKRFIVVEPVYDEFLEKFKKRMARVSIGNPMEDVDMGPMARKDLRDEVHDQVERSAAEGAEVILGGEIPKGIGAFYPATILTNVKHGMPAYHEEIFGPVASVIKVKDEEEAIKIANDTDFGLGACVFTKNLEKGRRIAEDELDAGCCFVNQYVKSDPRLPFGGIKESGYGRELSYLGIREFVNIKTVYIK
jgi:succinate-semialdehyde dehydrogenase/glutarate-semialdehyde dehydrogenase